MALLASSHFAAAEDHPSGVALHWVRDQGAESCVSGRTLTRELEQLVALQIPSADLSIEGSVRRESEPARWIARLRTVDGEERTTGVRVVESDAPDCAALTPSILLVLAWLIDSHVDHAPAQAAPASLAPEVAAPTPPAPLAQRPDSRFAPRIQRWHVEAAAAVAFAFGITPSTSIGPSAEARLVTPWRIALALGGQYWAADSAALKEPSVPGSSVEFRAVQGSLAVCVSLLPPSAWTLAGCWGGLLGSRFARASGLAEARNPARIYGGAINALRLGYDVHPRWSLVLDGTGAAFGREDRYVYEDAAGETRELYTPPRFGGWCTLGAAARF